MNFNLFILITITIANILLAALLLKRFKLASSKIFFGIIVLSIFWTILNYLADIKSLSTEIILLSTRLTFTTTALIALCFFLFSYYFPQKLNKFQNFKWIGLLLSVPVLALTVTSLVVRGVQSVDYGSEVLTGVLYPVFLVYFLIMIIGASSILVYKHKTLSGVSKLQIRYIFLGTLLSVIFASTTNLILPLFMGTNPYAKYGPYSLVFLIGFTSYAIVKHRLMDIRMIVARSVAYTLLIAIIGFLYVGSIVWVERIIFIDTTVSFWQVIYRMTITLAVIFTFQPLRKFITRKTDRVFFKQSYDPEKLLDLLSHTMGSTIVLIELLYKVLHILTNEMKVSRGFFVILKDGKTIDTTQGVGYKKSPAITLREIEILAHDGICIYDDLDEGSQVKRILRKHDAFIAIPLKSNNRVSGILFLGEKSSGDMYSAMDVRIFEILGPEVTVAVDNAKSYEEIQQFNAVLRQEIAKATKDLESANHNLRELDKAKDEFISMASHQLRTPLTAIKGYLSMLLEGDAGEIKMGQYEFVQEAYYGATRMVSLINDLLNVSRMETGRFFLEVTEFDLTKTIEEEVKQLERAAKDKGLKLVYQKHGHVSLCADEMKVRQVVMNFIDNALYYTINGKVLVNLYDEGENVRFEVTDNGIGVPKEQQKHLFTKFYRAENARATRPDGTGLGLFMAKKVIEEHHGEIIFHSKEGKGSTFGFRLPKKAKVTRDNTTGFDPNIPLETPVDKAIKVMDDKMKKETKEKASVSGK